jgi:predicted MFS family arabinose efflux permease
VAVAVGAPLGALVAAVAGWRGTFFAIAGLGAVAGATLWLRLPRGIVGTRLPIRARLAATLRPGVRPILLTTLFALTGAFTVFSYIAPLAAEVGLGEEALPLILLGFGIGAVVGNIAGGQLADRFGAARTVAWSQALCVVMLIGFSAVPVLLPHAVAGPALIALTVPWGIAGWSFPPAQASRIVRIAPDAAPIVLSLNGSALYLGVALGAFVGGQVLSHATPLDLGVVGAFFALASLATVALSHRAVEQASMMPAE